MVERTALPASGADWAALEPRMLEAKAGDADWRHGRLAVYVHYAGEEVLEVAKRAYMMFFSENGLGPAAFPSLARFEREVVEMTLGLLAAPPGAKGTMTSGGSESIFLAVKSARDRARARQPGIARPHIVAPSTVHPAFNKAAHYLGLAVNRIPSMADFRADAKAMAAAVTGETIMLVGSVPAFPHGVIDPVPALAEIARRKEIWLHVDACVGGFIAPFARRLGRPIPDFDFSVPGVASISADLHKYGFSAKGASTVLYADEEHFQYQAYAFDGWPRGRYVTQGFPGTRPGGAIAAAWAVMNHLGEAGYLDLARRIIATRETIEAGVVRLGLEVWGKPELAITSYGSRALDIFAVADGLAAAGWFVGRLAAPSGIHLMLTIAHEPVVEEYLAAVAAAVAAVRGKASPRAKSGVTY
ncbi:MAG: pyridoxal phosphate-dependent decarboxylase family protein [Alphaproteobacteria bacterium]